MLIDLSDILLSAGALGAALYCLVLSRRLKRFTDLEGGVGGAVAVLSAQVDDLTRTLTRAESAARGSVATLAESSARAEAAGRRLELLMASLHDLPVEAEEQAPRGPVFVRHAPGAAPGQQEGARGGLASAPPAEAVAGRPPRSFLDQFVGAGLEPDPTPPRPAAAPGPHQRVPA